MPGPIISAVASLIIPGLGQLLNKKYKRGGFLMGLWILVQAIVSVVALFLFAIIQLVFAVAAAIDAYRVAKEAKTWM